MTLNFCLKSFSASLDLMIHMLYCGLDSERRAGGGCQSY